MRGTKETLANARSTVAKIFMQGIIKTAYKERLSRASIERLEQVQGSTNHSESTSWTVMKCFPFQYFNMPRYCMVLIKSFDITDVLWLISAKKESTILRT